ncbi:hypothetical protein E2C01_000836 [Portunus trituberculatus]|uniref:Uncharacterized protein n=1 Tax=Portunus trituberculatus TaxID=210409 RepID=A0A5B7CFP4_PORTR|nr:hypothetical protein [Portunus trituberculatus]
MTQQPRPSLIKTNQNTTMLLIAQPVLRAAIALTLPVIEEKETREELKDNFGITDGCHEPKLLTWLYGHFTHMSVRPQVESVLPHRGVSSPTLRSQFAYTQESVRPQSGVSSPTIRSQFAHTQETGVPWERSHLDTVESQLNCVINEWNIL